MLKYCTIALISHASKVMLKILQGRLQQYMNWGLPDVQAGFRKDRGTRDQIANSHWISKKQESSKKAFTSALLTMPKPLTVSVRFSHSVVSDSSWPHEPQYTSLSITNSWSLLKLISIESVLPSNHLILCHPLLLLPSIFPSIRVFSNESALCIRTTRPKQTEKFFKRLEYQTTLPISCEICMQVKKQ